MVAVHESVKIYDSRGYRLHEDRARDHCMSERDSSYDAALERRRGRWARPARSRTPSPTASSSSSSSEDRIPAVRSDQVYEMSVAKYKDYFEDTPVQYHERVHQKLDQYATFMRRFGPQDEQTKDAERIARSYVHWIRSGCPEDDDIPEYRLEEREDYDCLVRADNARVMEDSSKPSNLMCSQLMAPCDLSIMDRDEFGDCGKFIEDKKQWVSPKLVGLDAWDPAQVRDCSLRAPPGMKFYQGDVMDGRYRVPIWVSGRRFLFEPQPALTMDVMVARFKTLTVDQIDFEAPITRRLYEEAWDKNVDRMFEYYGFGGNIKVPEVTNQSKRTETRGVMWTMLYAMDKDYDSELVKIKNLFLKGGRLHRYEDMSILQDCFVAGDHPEHRPTQWWLNANCVKENDIYSYVETTRHPGFIFLRTNVKDNDGNRTEGIVRGKTCWINWADSATNRHARNFSKALGTIQNIGFVHHHCTMCALMRQRMAMLPLRREELEKIILGATQTVHDLQGMSVTDVLEKFLVGDHPIPIIGDYYYDPKGEFWSLTNLEITNIHDLLCILIMALYFGGPIRDPPRLKISEVQRFVFDSMGGRSPGEQWRSSRHPYRARPAHGFTWRKIVPDSMWNEYEPQYDGREHCVYHGKLPETWMQAPGIEGVNYSGIPQSSDPTAPCNQSVDQDWDQICAAALWLKEYFEREYDEPDKKSTKWRRRFQWRLYADTFRGRSLRDQYMAITRNKSFHLPGKVARLLGLDKVDPCNYPRGEDMTLHRGHWVPIASQDGRLDVAVSAGRCRESMQMLFPGYVDMDQEFRVHPIDVVPTTMLLCWRMYDFNKRLAYRRYLTPDAEDRFQRRDPVSKSQFTEFLYDIMGVPIFKHAEEWGFTFEGPTDAIASVGPGHPLHVGIMVLPNDNRPTEPVSLRSKWATRETFRPEDKKEDGKDDDDDTIAGRPALEMAAQILATPVEVPHVPQRRPDDQDVKMGDERRGERSLSKARDRKDDERMAKPRASRSPGITPKPKIDDVRMHSPPRRRSEDKRDDDDDVKMRDASPEVGKDAAAGDSKKTPKKHDDDDELHNMTMAMIRTREDALRAAVGGRRIEMAKNVSRGSESFQKRCEQGEGKVAPVEITFVPKKNCLPSKERGQMAVREIDLSQAPTLRSWTEKNLKSGREIERIQNALQDPTLPAGRYNAKIAALARTQTIARELAEHVGETSNTPGLNNELRAMDVLADYIGGNLRTIPKDMHGNVIRELLDPDTPADTRPGPRLDGVRTVPSFAEHFAPGKSLLEKLGYHPGADETLLPKHAREIIDAVSNPTTNYHGAPERRMVSPADLPISCPTCTMKSYGPVCGSCRAIMPKWNEVFVTDEDKGELNPRPSGHWRLVHDVPSWRKQNNFSAEVWDSKDNPNWTDTDIEKHKKLMEDRLTELMKEQVPTILQDAWDLITASKGAEIHPWRGRAPLAHTRVQKGPLVSDVTTTSMTHPWGTMALLMVASLFSKDKDVIAEFNSMRPEWRLHLWRLEQVIFELSSANQQLLYGWVLSIMALSDVNCDKQVLEHEFARAADRIEKYLAKISDDELLSKLGQDIPEEQRGAALENIKSISEAVRVLKDDSDKELDRCKQLLGVVKVERDKLQQDNILLQTKINSEISVREETERAFQELMLFWDTELANVIGHRVFHTQIRDAEEEIRKLRVAVKEKMKISAPDDASKIRELEETAKRTTILAREESESIQRGCALFEEYRAIYTVQNTPESFIKMFNDVIEAEKIDEKISLFQNMIRAREQAMAKSADQRVGKVQRSLDATEAKIPPLRDEIEGWKKKAAEERRLRTDEERKVGGLESDVTQAQKDRDEWKVAHDKIWDEKKQLTTDRDYWHGKADEYWDDLTGKKRECEREKSANFQLEKEVKEQTKNAEKWKQDKQEANKEKRALELRMQKHDEEIQKKDAEIEELKRQLQEAKAKSTKKAEKRPASKKEDTKARSSQIKEMETVLEDMDRLCNRLERHWFYQRRFYEAIRLQASHGTHDAIKTLGPIREKCMMLKCQIEQWVKASTPGEEQSAPYGKDRMLSLMEDIGDHMQRLMESLHDAQCSLHPRSKFQLPAAEREVMAGEDVIELGDGRDADRRAAQEQMYVRNAQTGEMGRGVLPDFYIYSSPFFAHPPTALPADIPNGITDITVWTEKTTEGWMTYLEPPDDTQLQRFHAEKVTVDSVDARKAIIYGNSFDWMRCRNEQAGLIQVGDGMTAKIATPTGDPDDTAGTKRRRVDGSESDMAMSEKGKGDDEYVDPLPPGRLRLTDTRAPQEDPGKIDLGSEGSISSGKGGGK